MRNEQSTNNLVVVEYARYSSDLQKERSIDDQFRSLKREIDQLGWKSVEKFHDAGKSGLTIARRTGLLDLLEAIEGRAFDALIVESVDRLSRRPSEMHIIFESLEDNGIRLYSLQDGWISDVTIAIRAIESSSFIKKLRLNVKRGHEGAVATGSIVGSRAFGYRVERTNEMPAGGRAIHEEEKVILQRIFQRYAVDMQSPHKICQDLNKEQIPSSRGGTWTSSSLLGEKDRESGILRNSMYIGKHYYGKTTIVRRGNAVKRIAVDRSKWIEADFRLEHLRIISDELFNAAQVRAASRTAPINALHGKRRPKYLLTSKVHCGVCGRSMVVISGKYACRGRRAAVCSNGRRVDVGQLHEFVSVQLRQALSVPAVMQLYTNEFRDSYAADFENSKRERERLSRKVDDIDRHIKKLISLEGHNDASPSTQSMLLAEVNALRSERAGVSADLHRAGLPPTIELDDGSLSAALSDSLLSWHEAIAQGTPAASAAAEEFRRLVEKVVVTPLSSLPSPHPCDHRVEVFGPVAALMTAATANLSDITYKSSSYLVRYVGTSRYSVEMMVNLPWRGKRDKMSETTGWSKPI